MSAAHIAYCSRLDEADRIVGRALSVPADLHTLFYHHGGRLLDNDLDGAGQLVIGEIESDRSVVALPCGWYNARDLWPHLFPRQAIGQARPEWADIAAVANDQFGRKVDGQTHQGFAHRDFGNQVGFRTAVHGRLRKVMAGFKAFLRGFVE